MASSEDEGEPVPHTVSNYHFDSEKKEPISFSELPIEWDGAENPDIKRKQIFLHGTTDNGLQKLYKQVTAWKFDLSGPEPEILVLGKDKHWINLEKPRKSFEDIIRSILITVHCLHFIAKNPETSARSLWDHLSKVFSLYEIRPSEIDLAEHMGLISKAVERNGNLAKSKVLVTLLEEKPGKRKTLDEVVVSTAKSEFIVGDDVIDEIEDDVSDEEEELFDSVCSICDNGGDLLCCEGRCMRSFHATTEAGLESQCKSLGLSDEQVEAIQNFVCKNCQYKQHQCFACGELSSSDKLSGAEVFPCVSATCGRFYHPRCVAKLLPCGSEAEEQELQKKIAAGKLFTCPVHKCHVCKEGEEKMVPELQFAVCRRCPKSYHRKCLPKEIPFEDPEDEDIIPRAWEGLIPNRILIYCLDHMVDEELGTPMRDHIKFPKLLEKKKKLASSLLFDREKVVSREKSQTLEGASGKRIVRKQGVEMLSSANKDGDFSKKSEKRSSALDSLKKKKVIDASRMQLKKDTSTQVSKTPRGENDASLGAQLFAAYMKSSEKKSQKEEPADTEHEKTLTAKPAIKESSSVLPLDTETKKRIMDLVKDVSSKITLEGIIEKHKVPSTHAYSSKYVVDKTITLGKVEGSIEALRAALLKVEEGCSNEDAKAVCEPGILKQLVKWKNKLKVYLAPFLIGMRYTSFGRHFTKVDKLKEIVDILHCYVQDGDTIVDFCCGANDFSCLMKKKLDAVGKKCCYKNYDVLQPKNDFNFEKRDWMTVRPKELPRGSELIMGLNPPFGVNGALANKFINKALEFKPKLLILIVPPETERLDDDKKKRSPYDLIWEDDNLLSGMSFYLPGSVDVNDKQMDQWNMTPPPLYLWSRPDLTAKHKEIALQHGHMSRGGGAPPPPPEENHSRMLVDDDNPVEEDHSLDGKASIPAAAGPPLVPSEQEREAAALNGICEEGQETPENNDRRGKNQTDEKPRKRRRIDKKSREGSGLKSSSEDRSRQGLPLSSDKYKNMPPRHSPPKVNVPRRSPPKVISSEDRSRQGSPLSSDKYRNVPRHSPTIISSEDRSRQGSPLSDKYRNVPRKSPPKVRVPRQPTEPLEKQPSPEFGLSGEPSLVYGRTRDHMDVDHHNSVFDVARNDEVAKRYSLSREELYTTGNNAHGWSTGVNPGPDYASRHLDPQVHRPAYNNSNSLSGQGYPSTYGNIGYSSSYGTPGYSSSSSYGTPGSVVTTSYSRMSSSSILSSPAVDSTYSRMTTSATQRYAPKLDELNHTRPTNSLVVGSEPWPTLLRNVGGYNPLGHQPAPGYGGAALGGPPPGGSSFQAGSIGGFASEPYHQYSNHNSSGWIDSD